LSKRKGDAYDICDEHLVAQYSESLELLEDISQIDHNMARWITESEDSREDSTPLSLLCRRRHFSTFDAMVLSITEVEVMYDS
jgi:hypothetical protein